MGYLTVFDNLAFQVEGAKVTLAGQVTRPPPSSGAETVVKRVEGVTEVANRIELLPVSPNDDRIRTSVYRAIYYQPVLARYAYQSLPPIRIIVRDGDVTLEGFVRTENEKSIAACRPTVSPACSRS